MPLKCRLSWPQCVKGSHGVLQSITIFGAHNGLSSGRCQANIWTSGRILVIERLLTNLGETIIKIFTHSFKKMPLKMSFGMASMC